jgi:hypothetical protein
MMCRATKLFCFLLTAFGWIQESFADYKFLSGNPFEVQRRLIADIRAGGVDASMVDPAVVDSTTKDSFFAATPARLAQLGQLSKVCLMFGVKYPASRALVFRTIHENGCGDWVITTKETPEVLSAIILIPTKLLPGKLDTCGPPGVVPPVPAGGDNFLLPNDFRCRTNSEISSPPSNMEELKTACRLFPGMCPNAH